MTDDLEERDRDEAGRNLLVAYSEALHRIDLSATEASTDSLPVDSFRGALLG